MRLVFYSVVTVYFKVSEKKNNIHFLHINMHILWTLTKLILSFKLNSRSNEQRTLSRCDVTYGKQTLS